MFPPATTPFPPPPPSSILLPGDAHLPDAAHGVLVHLLPIHGFEHALPKAGGGLLRGGPLSGGQAWEERVSNDPDKAPTRKNTIKIKHTEKLETHFDKKSEINVYG